MTRHSLLPCKAAGLALIAAGLLAAPLQRSRGGAKPATRTETAASRRVTVSSRSGVPGTLHNLVADSGQINAPTVLSPELPGVNGTTGLSATPGGPACPSRADPTSGVPPGLKVSALTAWGFPCCVRSPCTDMPSSLPRWPAGF